MNAEAILHWLALLLIWAVILGSAWVVVMRHDRTLANTATAEAWDRGPDLFINPPIRLEPREPSKHGARRGTRADVARAYRNERRGRRIPSRRRGNLALVNAR